MLLPNFVLVGNALATMGATTLWGIGLHQLSQFYFKIGASSFRLKALVGWIGLWDTIRQIYTMTQVISDNSEPPLWDHFTVTYVTTQCIVYGDVMLYISSALVIISAQGYFVYRTWEFAGRPWPLIAFAVPFLSFQLGFPIGLYFLIPRTVDQFCPYIFKEAVGKSLLTATLSTGAALDVLTCLALTALLWNEYMNRSKVLKSTSAMLSRLILLSLNTGMWTALLAVFLVIMVHISATGNTQPLLGFYHLLSPLYLLTVLVNLNVRGYIRDTANKRGFSNVQLTNHIRSVLGPDSIFNMLDSTSLPNYTTRSRANGLDMPLDLFGPPHSEVGFL